MYHEVAHGDLEAWTVVRPDDFTGQMEWIKNHLEPLPIDDAIRIVQDRKQLPPGAVVVTFDDGYAGMKEHVLPLIERLEIPVVIYVATQAITEGEPYWHDRVILSLQDASGPTVVSLTSFGYKVHRIPRWAKGEARWDLIQGLLSDMKKLTSAQRLEVMERIGALRTGRSQHALVPLSEDDIRRLSDSPFVTIGAHTHCHGILTLMKPEDVWETILRSKELLEKWTGRSVEHFAYPNGDYQENIVDIVKEIGFKSAVTTEARPMGPGADLHAIPRFGIGRYEGPHVFRDKARGLC